LDEQRAAIDAHDIVWNAHDVMMKHIIDHDAPAWDAAMEEEDAMSERHGDLYREWKDLVFEIAEAQARTPEGIRAKAKALKMALEMEIPIAIGGTVETEGDAWDQLADSLAKDLLGRAEA
jgi:hypothetical protein